MADTLVSLADMVKINDVSVVDAGATDIFNDAPLLRLLAAIESSHGTDHKYLKEATAPVVGFRAPNTGVDKTASTDTLVTLNLKILDATAKMDKQLALNNPRGASYMMDRQGRRNLRAGFRSIEEQIINGSAALGFDGFAQALPNTTQDMCIAKNATGASGNTSVYAVRSTSDEANVCAIMGNNGNIMIDDMYETQLVDGTGKYFNGLVLPIEGWAGLQVGGSRSIARLANVQTGASKTLTDVDLATLYGLFPEEAPPTHFVMNMRSTMQLQQSRTTYSPTGAPAPIPTEWNGIPIVMTSSVKNDETLVVA